MMERSVIRNRIPSAHLFLMELLFALLIFAIASAACVNIFARSKAISDEARDLAYAAEDLSSAAQLIRSSDTYVDVITKTSSVYPDAETRDSGFTLWFDQENLPCAEDRAAYLLFAELSMEDSMLKADLSFMTSDIDPAVGANNAESVSEDTGSAAFGTDSAISTLEVEHYVKEGVL